MGGSNYGQGSSREHAALAPRHLGLRLVLAKSFARIHEPNLANFGILPLRFHDPDDYERVERGDRIRVSGVRRRLQEGEPMFAENLTRQERVRVTHQLSPRQVRMVLAGSVLNLQAGEGAERE